MRKKSLIVLLCAACALPVWTNAEERELRVLFLGDKGAHRPEERFKQLQPALRDKEIELTYTDSLSSLSSAALKGFDCVLIYANHTRIAPEQERALLDFVEEGGGFVPIHSASFCFHNSPKYIELVGAQFKSHGAGVFRETIVKPEHPVMKGLGEIESWDESYVHDKHNNDRLVLAERRDEKGAEPYTWVREHGKGRVFYTAWGHDQRTWENSDFQALVERGIRWASANSPAQLPELPEPKPFEYVDAPAPLPNYVPNARWGTQAEPIRTMQKAMEPMDSMKRLSVFPEFEKSLFASEPDIVKPIWLAWDERGRLWIAETLDYPNEMQPPGEGRDRLKIVEDTDGDGHADKFTVFADRLSVPTSFVFANGGVIVLHSGKTEFLKDTDGDDRADERRDLFTGWGTNDTHAGPSNLRYGFDNWIWGVVGYSGFQGTVGGKEIRFGQGIFRFKPDGSELEFIRSSNNNTWGLGFSEDGLVFGSTANGNASMHLAIPNRYYEAVSEWSASRLETIADSQRFYAITDKVRQVDFHDRYTAGAGSAIYTARSFPREYWNGVQFVTEPTGHLVGRFFLIPNGSTFVAHNAANFLASDDEWTSPIAAEVGPDGALWVIDWYNYIIQHNPTPQGFENGRGNAYVTPLRDKRHGRIYRIVHKEGQPSEQFKLGGSSEGLLKALKSDNMHWRLAAQRLIVDGKKKDLAPGLIELVKDRGVDELGLNPAAIHALWALDGLGMTGEKRVQEAIKQALKHPSPGVRRAAALVLPRTNEGLAALLGSGVLEDRDAQARLGGLLALAEMPAGVEAGSKVFALLQDGGNADDRWMRDAITTAAARHDAGFLAAVFARFEPEQAKRETPANLIENGSFERASENRPQGWRPVTHSGLGDLAVADSGRTGSKSVRITSERGGDLSWAVRVEVKPRTEYRLSGWIKTEKLDKIGGAQGAMLNIHEFQHPVSGGTKTVTGTTDWTPVHLDFNSGDATELTINCLFGGWGRATGTAWFDDIQLMPVDLGGLSGEAGRVVRLVTAHYARRAPNDSIVSTLAALKGSPESLAAPVLDGLISGWPEGEAPELDAAREAELHAIMASLPEQVRDRMVMLSRRWGSPGLFRQELAEIVQSLEARMKDGSKEEGERIAAASRLVNLSGQKAAMARVLEEITTLTPPALASGLIAAVAESRSDEAGQAILERWAQYTPSVRRNAVSALLRRSEWAGALLDAVQAGKIKRNDIATEHWAQMKQSRRREVAARAEELSKAGGAVSQDVEKLTRKILESSGPGEPNTGREVYATACSVCHAFNGEGGKVGPDLTGIAARDRGDILLDILDPNRSVEANYQLWNVSTKDNETFSGRLETETQTTVEILDTAGIKHVIQRKDIAGMQTSGASIMPAGFETLPEEQLKGLLAYLTAQH